MFAIIVHFYVRGNNLIGPPGYRSNWLTNH